MALCVAALVLGSLRPEHDALLYDVSDADLRANVRQKMQATGMVSRTWLTSFFDKDGGKLFREFTMAMRRSSNWDGLRMLSDAELWDSLFSSDPPWARVSSLPYNDCIIGDRWRKFDTYRCIFHTDGNVTPLLEGHRPPARPQYKIPPGPLILSSSLALSASCVSLQTFRPTSKAQP